MKAELIHEKPIPPPAKIVLTLNEQEARVIKAMIGSMQFKVMEETWDQAKTYQTNKLLADINREAAKKIFLEVFEELTRALQRMRY